MANSNTFNHSVIVGRITTDPTMRTNTYGDKTVYTALFTVAVSRNYKNKNDEFPTDFISCKAQGPLAEKVISKLKKGEAVSVGGSIESYSQKLTIVDKDGNHKEINSTKLILNVSEFNFLPNSTYSGFGKNQNSQNNNNENVSHKTTQNTPLDGMDFEEIIDEEDDLPF